MPWQGRTQPSTSLWGLTLRAMTPRWFFKWYEVIVTKSFIKMIYALMNHLHLLFLLRRSFRGWNSKLLKLSSSLLTVNSLLHSTAGINLILEVLFYLTRYPVQCWYRFRLKFSFSLHVVLLLVCSLLHSIPPNSSHITLELESEISLTTGKLTCQSVSTLSAWCLNEYTKF